jgi:hypothetical protein
MSRSMVLRTKHDYFKDGDDYIPVIYRTVEQIEESCYLEDVSIKREVLPTKKPINKSCFNIKKARMEAIKKHFGMEIKYG